MIKKWLRNKNKMSTIQPQQSPSTVAQQSSLNTIANTTIAGGSAIASSNYYGTYVINGNTTAAGTITVPASGVYSIGNTGFFNSYNNLISLSNNGKEILRVEKDGKIIWADDINIDEAAEALSKSLSISIEMKAGINKRIKREIRNSIFEDLISIAKEKGSLSVDELTYLLEGAKIMDKLKGGDE